MTLEVTAFVNGKWEENCYLAANGENGALIVDPGSQAAEIADVVRRRGWRIHGILNTHAHYDHVGAVAPLQEEFGAPFYLHSGDAVLLKRANLYRMLFESREAVRVPEINHDISSLPHRFEIGPFAVEWIATPGHTDGSVCLLIGEYLFSGDTLMRGCTGRTDLPGGNRDLLLASVRKLMQLPPSTVVLGGHGPATTIGDEFRAGARVWKLMQ